jgi:hypothetical protein
MMPFDVEMQNGPKLAKCCFDGRLLFPAPATPATVSAMTAIATKIVRFLITSLSLFSVAPSTP